MRPRCKQCYDNVKADPWQWKIVEKYCALFKYFAVIASFVVSFELIFIYSILTYQPPTL